MGRTFRLGTMLFCFVLTSGVAAFAEDSDAQAARRAEFQKIDRDNSIFVTHEEMEAYCDERFNAADKDGDSILNDDEVLGDKTGGMFATADQNKDKKVTREEARARYNQYFNEIDTNKDNQISADEYVNSGKVSVKF
ncbi:MAG: hypothetical protein Q8O22_02560 [Candidatus Omnitrophota bacterium]|nr:hypothetical protein [Candidatus Omnitrophota bacterium]